MQNTEDTLQTRWPTGARRSHSPQCSHGHPAPSAGQHGLFPGLLLSASVGTRSTPRQGPGWLERLTRTEIPKQKLPLASSSRHQWEKPGVEPCCDQVLRWERSGWHQQQREAAFGGISSNSRHKGSYVFTDPVPHCSSVRSSRQADPDGC